MYVSFEPKIAWYFVPKIVLTFCEKKCSSDWEKLLKFESEGREFANILRLLDQFITAYSERSDLKDITFLTYSWRFLRSNKLEQFKLEKKNWHLE